MTNSCNMSWLVKNATFLFSKMQCRNVKNRLQKGHMRDQKFEQKYVLFHKLKSQFEFMMKDQFLNWQSLSYHFTYQNCCSLIKFLSSSSLLYVLSILFIRFQSNLQSFCCRNLLCELITAVFYPCYHVCARTLLCVFTSHFTEIT